MAVDEDTSSENLALALDLCAKFGLIVQDSVGEWVIAPNADVREGTFIGDFKTIDCLDKVIRDQEQQPPSSKTSSVRANVSYNEQDGQ